MNEDVSTARDNATQRSNSDESSMDDNRTSRLEALQNDGWRGSALLKYFGSEYTCRTPFPAHKILDVAAALA